MITKTSFSSLLFFLFVLQMPILLFGSKAQVTNLRCEYLVNPLGIDVEKPRLSWQIHSDEANFKQAAYEIRVAESPSGLGKTKKLIWSSGIVASDQSVNVEYKGSKPEPKKRYFWQVRIWDSRKKASDWSETGWWETGLTDSALWKAEWIAAQGKGPDDHSPVSFRKDFNCGKTIRSARLYCSSLGLYQIFINGSKVSPDLFTPGWTSFNKRIQYQTYDVTAMVQSKNAITALVGDGWYRGNIGGKVQRNYYGDRLALIAQLEISYTDGTSQQVYTDTSWQAGNSAILASDIYNGESFDAGWEKAGWDRYGFKSSDFKAAEILNHPKNILLAQHSNPVRAIAELKPLKLILTPAGETVFDMGQNMVGWVRLKVQGQKGDRVVLKFAEVLDHSGNFYTENLRKAKATDEYILKGGAPETFEPHFTFHGFRYVKMEQFPGTADLNTVTGVVIHTDMEPTGSFVCSDTLINKLQHNIQWGQKGNFLDVPTDCPQRDERLGWTGDAQVFAPTAAFNFDVAPFFSKWMADLAADQLPDGGVTDVVPDVRSGRGSSAAWGDAAIVVPWTVYQAYGDTRILEEQYATMKAWVEYMRKMAGDGYLWTNGKHYGDWLAFASTDSDYPGATTETDLIATAYYAFSSGRLAQIATILGKTDDAHIYGELALKIKAAFCDEFVTPSGRLVSSTQTAYALALSFRLLPDSMNTKAASYLAADVQKMEHLTTGFVGTPLLCQALSDFGYADQAFMLLMNREYPSWLYPVTQRATTIWERWDGQKPDGTFQDKSMNSFNHYAYGAIGNWLYNYVAGIRIDPSQPGYKHFFLQPHAGGGLTHASAELKTMYGVIRSAWKIENGEMNYTCEVPENTSATVCFDLVEAKNILMNNQSLSKQESMKVSDTNGKVKIKIGSGTNVFKILVSEKNR